jgi:hypothetical protein
MTDILKSAANTPEGGPSKLREWTTSTMLIGFTILLGLVCVLVLTCTLAQTRIAAISIDGVSISIWKLNDLRKQWNGIRDQIRTATDDLASAEQQVSVALKENSDFEDQSGYRQVRAPLDGKLDAFLILLRQSDDKLATAINSDAGTYERVTRIQALKDTLLKAHPDWARLIDELETMGAAYNPIDKERLRLRGNVDEKKALVKARQERLKSLQTSLDTFAGQFNGKPIDGATRARMENALFELYTGSVLGPFMNSLIVTPPDYLTLALVISMGLLGSALQMTHALVKRDRIERAGSYFLRLSVGAITALVIFIVAKAGVPVIADASRLGGDAPINPYFVSFLAIIAGLMSESAIISIQTQGARFFAPETPPEQMRWARSDLVENFKAANRDPDKVARLLNVDISQFNEWISGRQAIPANAQTMISGVLEIPRRDLFTDLPPEEPRQSADGK